MSQRAKTTNSKLQELIELGVSLASEKEVSPLLDMILKKALDFTQCEGAHIYLLREQPKQKLHNIVSLQKESELHFIRSYHILNGFCDHRHTLNIDHSSAAGYCVLSKEMLNINDCLKVPENSAFQLNPFADLAQVENPKSLLTLPMISSEGKVRGVLQLVNKLSARGHERVSSQGRLLKKHIVSFQQNDFENLSVLTSYASIALENSQLTESIENLFESFVRASVKAIESRDPTTSGHSDRVAMMTVELALATHKVKEGPFKFVSFSEEQIKELRYASLLHDFGKIGVTEPVLLKKKKLHDRELESVLLRFDTIGSREESMIWKHLCERLVAQQQRPGEPFDSDQAFKGAIQQVETLRARLRQLRSHVITANEPQVMSADFDIHSLVEKLQQGNDYFNKAVLTQNEIKTLSIPRGSLTKDERQEIESHVSHTYEFLKQIAWTDNLSHVTTIAHCHHEKMDGSGYPRGIKGEEIPIQSRMMTIADIYDALTAFDRPYKKSISEARALEILIQDARAGRIDGHLLKVFIEAGVFHNATLGRVKKAS